MTELERCFWEKKLAIARQNHIDELRRMGTTGASLRRLGVYVRDIERAERRLRIVGNG